MNTTRALIISMFIIFANSLVVPDLSAQMASFLSPDTVYTNQPVPVTNTSTGGSSWYWNFCSGNSLSNPEGVNIGNPGNLLNIPGYITLAKDGELCYSFITTHGSNRVVRYCHGKSFSNNPVSWDNLGDFGLISDTVQGIKIRNDNGQWFGFIVDNSKIVRLNFGPSLANTPTATLVGRYAMLYFSHGFDLFFENGTWIGFLTCSWGDKMVRLNFGNSLMNNPLLTNLGTPGSMNMPTTFCFIKENDLWEALIVNYGDNTLTRLSFGNSLLNTPTGVNLGNVCPSITAAGIALVQDCESTIGFQLNTSTTSPDLIWRLNFPTGITGPVTGVSLGNIGAMSQPLRFSELIRVGDTLFLYNTNRLNSSLTRLRFVPCTNASVPSSVLFTPPQFSYSQPGTYNIRLIVNEGLPNQSSICKSIVVIDTPIYVYVDTTLCFGTPWYAGGAIQTQPGIYHDTIQNAGYCDSIIQTTLRYKPEIPVFLGNDTILCDGPPIVLQTGVSAAVYQWQDGSADSAYTAFGPGNYWVIVTKDGCNASDSIKINDCVSPLWFPNVFTPNGDGTNDTFHPVGKGVVRFNMLIFDRWGKQVFGSDSMDPGWDGRIKGEMCSDGVYTFIATYETDLASGEIYHANGTVTILR
jgi:gliding motility-associated-like protein